MANNGGRRTARRVATGIGVVAAGSLIASAGTGVANAEPEQSREDVQKKLDELNEEAGKIVDEYNEANEDYKAAKAKADELEEQVGEEQDRYEELKEEASQIASAVYQGGDLDSKSFALTVEDPEDLMDQAADVGKLSDNQKAKLDEFSDSNERLFKLKDEADSALEEAKGKKDEAEDKKDEVEKKISEQEDLLAEFPEADASPEGDSASGSDAANNGSGNARAALDFALSQVGKPYIYGAAGPDGYDCSGLVMRSWENAGVSLPRTTYGQAEAGTQVSRDQLQPGDILFFSGLGHDGLYLGNGQMVHAPRTGKNVEVVPLAGYWDGQFMYGVRV
ncbi:NlpC/P60 family protein [Nocardiopsis sp. RSe5-2]|uniref:NlpC/P60 family protein n=1 Tax=Nocardiopsis endophytica TaxID=3018445 RepID=A0ABT4UB31_9ACTN|nr:C40 family peptidase [Nocardiopsis endophytica]MDA2814156.1 NlpC/P60 family protein [Nocardiopsis endophytica]